MNKKIAIDFDGTITRVMDLICTLVNFKCSTSLTSKQVSSWEFFEQQGLEKEFWEVYDLMDKSDLRLGLCPYDLDTVKVLNQLSWKIGQPIDILTCNHKEAANSIKAWFDSWEDEGPTINVKCIGRATSKEKLELPYDIYIDDSPHMAEMIHEFPNKKMILMNAPWNQNAKENGQVVRVHRWKNVIPTLYKMDAFPPVKYAKSNSDSLFSETDLKEIDRRLAEIITPKDNRNDQEKTRDTEDLYYK
jgi:5'(3')-deoxyribonucleotidase